MKRLATGIAATVVIVAGAWLALVADWVRHFDETRRHE